jgi:hypothetical protein
LSLWLLRVQINGLRSTGVTVRSGLTFTQFSKVILLQTLKEFRLVNCDFSYYVLLEEFLDLTIVVKCQKRGVCCAAVEGSSFTARDGLVHLQMEPSIWEVF